MGPRGLSRFAAGAPLCLIGAGVLLVVGLHAVAPGVDPRRQYISEYATDGNALVLGLALLLVAAGAASLAVALRDLTGSRLGPGLLLGLAGCLAVAAVLPTDRWLDEVPGSLSGQVHGVVSIAGFAFLVLAMLVLSADLRAHERWSDLAELTRPLAVGAVLAAGLAATVAPSADGVRQRLFLAIVFGWLLATAARLRATAGGPEATPGPRGLRT